MAGGEARATVHALLTKVADAARNADVFADVTVDDGAVRCVARDAAAHAEFRLCLEDGGLWVGMYTPDRWLSQSIEADLMHTGDKLEDLIDEELVDLGCDAGPLPFEHFRNDDKEYVFRSPTPFSLDAPAEDASRVAGLCLLAYEAAMRELGDMSGGEDKD